MTSPLRNRLQATLGAGYTLGRELGGGGMSRLFAAEQHALGRRVVVKVLPPDAVGAVSAVSAVRFQREILVAASLQHPLIVPVLHAGNASDVLYFTMPLIEGESLRARLDREGPLPVPDVLRIVRDVSTALAAAHERGVVHRDIKPDNILLSGGFALVTDFGVAKALERAREATGNAAGRPAIESETADRHSLTAPGMTLGTPAYMSPEQAMGEARVDHRSDIYSLGATTYEMLTGRPPFGGPTAQSVIAAHLTRTPEPPAVQRPSVPPALDSLVMQCLEKEPADRPQRADDVRQLVEPLLAIATDPDAQKAGEHPGSHPTPRSASGERGRVRRGGRGGRGGRWRAATLIAGMAGIAAGGGTLIIARRPAPTAATREGSVADLAIRSIAVLPFVNASADADNEYFSDGVSEEIIDALAKVGGMRVASRSSSFAFKGRSITAPAIGESLRVQAVIEGSVRAADGKLRITAQLTSASDGSALWSERYDRELRDVFAVQEELARSILAAVRQRLIGAPVNAAGASPLVRQGTADPAAYELYLRGRFHWNQRSREGFVRAADYFRQAIARDSSFARAWSGLADSNCILANFGYRLAHEVCPLSEQAARRALALDSTLAEAHASIGFVRLFYDWDLDRAQRALDRALALDSTYASAHLWSSHVAWVRGDTAEMLARMRRALALEPFSMIMNSRYAIMLWRAGRIDEAMAQFDRALALDPQSSDAHRHHAVVQLERGRHVDAIREMQEYASDDWVAYAHARAGRGEEARRLLRGLEGRAARGEYVSPIRIAYIHAALGNPDAAFRWLERARRMREPDVVFVEFEPYSLPLRGDPRFAGIVRAIRTAAHR